MMKFDYETPAELFMAKRKGGSRQPLGYRRFGTAAEAIRFAVEELPAVRTLGAWLQVGDDRYDVDERVERNADASEQHQLWGQGFAWRDKLRQERHEE